MIKHEDDIRIIEQKVGYNWKMYERDRKNDKEALKVQAAEYERRLSDLNHEAEQLKKMQNTFVLQEIYDQNEKNIDARIGALELAASKESGRKGVYVGIYGLVIILLTVGLNFLIRPKTNANPDDNKNRIEMLENKLQAIEESKVKK